LAKRKQKTKINLNLPPYAQYSLICYDAAQIVSNTWIQCGEASDRWGHEYQGDSPAATKFSITGAVRKACKKAGTPDAYPQLISWLETWMRTRDFINDKQSIIDWNETKCEDGEDAEQMLKAYAKRMSKKWRLFAVTLSQGRKENEVWEP
jgi:hypothetical protein